MRALNVYNQRSSTKAKFKVRINQVLNLLAAISFLTTPDLSFLFITDIWILKLN